MTNEFNEYCIECPRLSQFLVGVKVKYPSYYAKPVPPFGDSTAQFLIVGLAPGMHGANKTGRPFTGDHASILLYETLHQFGFATAPTSVASTDDLQLLNCRITNAVKCLPPENKPETSEIVQCNHYLAAELNALPAHAIILALGNIAHLAVLKALKLKIGDYKFAHAARYSLPNGLVLYDSYHCSRYNTQTKRLTAAMFQQVFATIAQELKE